MSILRSGGRIILLLLVAGLGRLYGQGSGFTYQGHHNDGGAAANGTYDLRFALFDAANGGNQVGLSLTNSGLAVITGSFGASLDFGTNAFTGQARWLELGARTNGEVAFVTVSPRQPITPTPYALYALTPAGPQGIKGNPGAPGPQGAQGPQGVPGLTWRGAWNVSTSYATNDAVQSGGSAWVAELPNTGVVPVEGASWTMLAQKGDTGSTGPTGATGTTGATGAAGSPGAQGPQGVPGLTWRGAWSVGVIYVVNDAVQSGGSAWVALQANTGVTPIEGASWTTLAQKGDTGTTGPQEPQGVQGVAGPTGPQGIPGPTGLNGTNGVAGATGPQGPQGVPGPAGATGPQGAQGPQGAPGVDASSLTNFTVVVRSILHTNNPVSLSLPAATLVAYAGAATTNRSTVSFGTPINGGVFNLFSLSAGQSTALSLTPNALAYSGAADQDSVSLLVESRNPIRSLSNTSICEVCASPYRELLDSVQQFVVKPAGGGRRRR